MIDGALVFDLDGTLFDTSPEIYLAVKTAAKAHGYEVSADQKKASTFMGNGISRYVKRMLTGECWSDPEKESFKKVLNQSMQEYQKLLLTRDSLYPDVEKTLTQLQDKGWLLAIATNKLERFTHPLLERYLNKIDFKAIVCKDSVAKPKPEPDSLLYAVKCMDKDPKQAVIIGDSMVDIKAGKNAGFAATVAVSYGYHQGYKIEELKADHVIDGIGELSNLCDSIIFD